MLLAPFDEQWLIPDHRLIDAARPELWRVADERQVFVVEHAEGGGPHLLATPLLPLLRTGRIRPLYRRPGGAEPNLAPGLPEFLARHLGLTPGPVDVLAWILAAARADLTVPLTGDLALWSHGVETGRRMLWLLRRDGDRPKLPGGRRPYVRAPLPARPGTLHYDRDEETLHLDEGRVSPCRRRPGTSRRAGPGSWSSGSRRGRPGASPARCARSARRPGPRRGPRSCWS
ncbi:hypothetical protein GCM10020295_66330 [Streptomyces cinereospinus]